MHYRRHRKTGDVGTALPVREATAKTRSAPPLTSEEELLAVKVALSVAREFSRRFPRDREEIISDALYGLAKALKKVDHQADTGLSAVAYQAARWEILAGIQRRSPLTWREWSEGVRQEDIPEQWHSPILAGEWAASLPWHNLVDPADMVASKVDIQRLADRVPDRTRVALLMAASGCIGAEIARELGWRDGGYVTVRLRRQCVEDAARAALTVSG